ncbi:MAG: hypothetical protein Q9183_005246, partial [Haloplaca sp. 2 TL-2023]
QQEKEKEQRLAGSNEGPASSETVSDGKSDSDNASHDSDADTEEPSHPPPRRVDTEAGGHGNPGNVRLRGVGGEGININV